MSEPAAFRATYSDLRFVKSRKVAQVIVELPIEDAGRFVEAFGAPNPATETWVAIARLQEPVKAQEKPKEKRNFADMPPAQQAALLCKAPSFHAFLMERFDGRMEYARKAAGDNPEDQAAQFVRMWCGVRSRSDIKPDNPSGRAWKQLDDAYFGWQRGVS